MRALLAASVFALGLSLGVAPEAAPITCQASKIGDGYWAWRVVDGRRCWYKGARRMSKTRLAWPAKAHRSPGKPFNAMWEDCLQVSGEGCDKLLKPAGGFINLRAYLNDFVTFIRGQE